MQRLTPGRRVFGFRFQTLLRTLVVLLVSIAVIPPIYFQFKLRRIDQIQMERCGWLINPPLVCAHGGDATNAFPNTMAAYNRAIHSQVDCIEIDVSQSSDGVLFALHDRDLQRISGNDTSKVGYFSMKEIKDLAVLSQINELDVNQIPTIEDALTLASGAVHQIVLDAKVGPPLYEKGLAENILAVVKRTQCMNCIIWAKSDNLVRDIIRLASNFTVGYIVMKDPYTGARSNLLRIKKAAVVGVFHPLINKKLVKILHGRGKKVYAWTVDDAVSMKGMLSQHVDAVVTSNPVLFRQVMQDARIRCVEEGYRLR